MRTLATLSLWFAATLFLGCSRNPDVAIGTEESHAGLLSTNEHCVAYIGAGPDGTDVLLVMTDADLHKQPELDLRKALPPVDHNQAVDLALASLRKEFAIDSYFVEGASLERIIPQEEDPTVNAPGWNWYKGKFYWRVELSWYQQEGDLLSLCGFGVTRGVLMTGEVLEPVRRKAHE